MSKKPTKRQPSLESRKSALRELTNQIGVYVLRNLDRVPIYVEQSVDGIRARVNRHLTSARSDIIANRRIDVLGDRLRESLGPSSGRSTFRISTRFSSRRLIAKH